MDPISALSIAGSVLSALSLCEKVACDIKHISQSRNEYRSIQKELDNLASTLKVLQATCATKDVDIHRQQLPMIIDKVNSVRRLVEELKQLLEQSATDIADERKIARFVRTLWDFRHLERLEMDISTNRQVLKLMTHVLASDKAQVEVERVIACLGISAKTREVEFGNGLSPEAFPSNIQPSPRSAVRAFSRLILQSLAVGTSCLSFTVLHKYELTHPNRTYTNNGGKGGFWVEKNGLERCDYSCQVLHWPRHWIQTFHGLLGITPTPSPAIFVVAVLTYGLATSTYYLIRKHDEYKDVFIIGGVIIGTAAGWLSDADIQGILLSFLPECILASLVLSAFIHQTVEPRWQREMDKQALLQGMD